MYRSKKDVDKHVQNLTSKLPLKEFQTRAYSIARLYYEVGDYASCQRYVEQYLTQKDNNAAAHKLLGLALQKMGQKEKAIEHYKTSLDIDPTQTSTFLDICELLADDEVEIDPGRTKYWCEKAEATFPRHPITFKLRERLLRAKNPDAESLIKFLKAELTVRPKDAVLHTRLLKHYVLSNQIREAFDHSCNIEFDDQVFLNNYTWYDTVSEILKNNSLNTSDWLYQLLLLTVKERMCVLSLTEVPSGSSKSLVESNDLLCAYDQALECVNRAGAPAGFGEFHSSLLRHHRGQLAFHTATYLLKKAKKNQLPWREATKLANPLMLIAWHITPLDPKVNWLLHAPTKQQNAIHRYYLEGSYRCSQTGHYILSNMQENSQVFLDQISQFCSGAHWRNKIYEVVFSGRDQLTHSNQSHLVSNAFNAPALRLPRKQEIEAYDDDAQRVHPNSLHHFVWILLNYKNFAKFKCSLFDMLLPTSSNYGAESLNKLDILAFLYSTTLTTQNKGNQISVHCPGKPNVLPANITELLCSLAQMKWWDCAYKYSQNELGTDLTGIHATLSSGIEVVRCIDNHGLDPKLLCILGRIFSDLAKSSNAVDEKKHYEIRAMLYYSSAINLLEKLKAKVTLKMPEKRLFEYSYNDFDTKELNTLIETCKLYIATSHIDEGEYEKAIELLSSLKSPQAFYYLSDSYMKLALEEKKASKDDNLEMKYVILLNKAKHFAYKALEKLKQTDISYKDNPLYLETQKVIEDIECYLNKVDPDISNSAINEFSSDESVDEYISLKSNSKLYHKQKVSSTPKPQKIYTSTANMTNYRTAVDTQILESSTMDHQLLERIEKQIKVLQKRDTSINDFMEHTKEWFDENRKLGNQIISTINSNIQNTTEQFKLLKISVDQVKDQIQECKSECKDVGDLKKQIAELKKEVNKLKKASSEQTIDESDLYNLDEEYRGNDNVSGFGSQIPFGASQVIPPFAQRLMPPFPVPTNPYQLYGQNLYNLYNQYSQFPQVSTVPGSGQLFDPSRSQANYPGIYPTPDQMYLDVSHLVPPTIPTMPTVPTMPAVPTVPVPSVSSISTVPVVTSTSIKMSAPTSKVPPSIEVKDTSKLPVNVVITSSDPLPACTSAPAPILSVTIPQKHIKGSPHNYQIPMPSSNETKGINPSPVFSFASAESKGVATTTVASFPSWNQSSVFATNRTEQSGSPFNIKQFENSKTVVDGIFSGPSPNNSLNKSRTLSEKSNTSIENYDPCPDFKPIIPLPAEVKVTTGEEDETVIFSSRAKLFRFVDKQWKERGLGEMKLLKHKVTGKVRVLMRREQIHKVCANHIISADMEIMPMKNETKAYFWVANDFAEETVILEKFCIRFKTAELAKQFYDVFEKARQEALVSSKNVIEPSNIVKSTTNVTSTPNILTTANVTSTPNKSAVNEVAKTVVGGFTFSTAPTFKPVSESTKIEQNSTESTTNKTNIFSGLTFKTNTTSPFANILNTSSNDSVSNKTAHSETPNKLNTSDVIEEFEPTVEFKPVIPLPALIDHKTGEEDETILFEHRAKLLRFNATNKEWKERGLGNIKLLVNKNNIQKVRLLMRREQIMKVCCNHAITKEMVFQKMPNMDKAVTWCAKDFSDGDLVAETFCLRFKTVEACDNFVTAVKSAQSKLNDNSKAIKDEQNAAKQNTESGFGDKFKPKPGSWHCETCYTNNLENFEQCACCEQPKPKENSTTIPTSKSIIPASYTFGFGDKYKPKPGTWECKTCMVRNESESVNCTACNTGRDTDSVQKSDSKLITTTTTTTKNTSMTFGIPGQTQSSLAAVKDSAVPQITGWGDKFKPKEGSWECSQCFVRNNENTQICCACNSPKNSDTKVKNQVSNLFEAPASQKFNFGIPANQTAIVVSFGEQKATTSVFAITKQPSTNDGPINFCLKKTDESKPTKPALLPTPQFNWTEIKNYDFLPFQSNTSITELPSNQDQSIDSKSTPLGDQKEVNKVQRETEGEIGSDDVEFVKEIQATAEEKQRAKELMLPENFFTYKTKDPCQGCRGCKSDDEDLKPEPVKPIKQGQKTVFDLSTPVKPSKTVFQSPMNSVYGTPNSFDRTLETSVFRTPLGSLGSNTNSATLTSSNNSMNETDVTNKENTFTEKTSNGKQTSAKTSVLMPPKINLLSTSKSETAVKTDQKPTDIKSIFGETTMQFSMNKPIFGSNQNKAEDAAEPVVKSIFGTDDQKPVNLFGSTSQGSIFGPAAMKNFGFTASGTGQTSVFGNVFNKTSTNIFSSKLAENQTNLTNVTENTVSTKETEVTSVDKKDTTPFKVDSNLTFAALSTSNSGFNTEKKADFQWEGAGQQLFGAKSNDVTDSGAGAGGDEEYDPHYEPIVPLPDKVVVTTGEEDEEKLYGERCKLYRYDEKSREWKERGVGEMKLLYHPERNTYRLLLRREQVHKAVLNMLIFKNLALLPMKNTDRAWTWAGQNFAEGAPEQETLAVRFKSAALAKVFHDKVVECVEKLMSASEETKKEEANLKCAEVAPLRLPKHLQSSARADKDLSANVAQQTHAAQTSSPAVDTSLNQNGQFNKEAPQSMHKQVYFDQDEKKQSLSEDEDDNEVYDNSEEYYNEKLKSAPEESKKEETNLTFAEVAPLRLPKHLQSSARADKDLSANVAQQTQAAQTSSPAVDTTLNQNGQFNKETPQSMHKQVYFERQEEKKQSSSEDEDEDDNEDYDNDYDNFEGYYNEEDEESAVYYACEGEAIVQQGESRVTCEHAHVQVLYDQEIYSPKILVTDSNTGETLADMLIYTDTEFQLSGDSCTWSGLDYTQNDAVEKTVTVNFSDSETTMQFYDSCETSKSATYTSTDPEG